MPRWALVVVGAVTVALSVTLTTLWILTWSERDGWTLGVTALATGLAALLALAFVLTMAASVLRAIDRRTR